MSTRRVLSKKGKVILIVSIVFGVIFIGASGYLLWRINQEKSLSTDEVDAASNCIDSLGYVKDGCLRCQCQDGAWVVGKGTSCWTLCGSMGHNKPPSTTGGYCIQGSQCPACEWPLVAYCGCSNDTTPSPNTCGCRRYNDFTCGVPCGTVQSCNPDSCPDGWVDCGTSGKSGTNEAGCVAKTSCEGKCLGCSNEFVVKRYCKPKKANVCDGGGWTKQVPAAVEYGQSVEISGYGKDSDGVPVNSVVLKLDGTSVGNGNAKVDSSDSTKTNWLYTFTDLSVGEHTITVSWKDTEGATSSDCELSATLTVNEENVCDGGGWTKQPPSTVEYGENIEVSGYGKDSDGVDPDSVKITLDGENVSGVNSFVDITDSTKTIWEYTIEDAQEGNHTLVVSWKDTEGLGGADCTLSSNFTVSKTVITNPDWKISKIGTPSCQEGATDELDKVLVLYEITITNQGNAEGTIEKIVDDLDDKVSETILVSGSVTSGGIYSNGNITWDLSEAEMTFSPGESKSYQYSILVPRESFGTYQNTVTATPTEGDSFSATAIIQTICSLIQTGMFDEAWGKIALGFTFLAVGLLYMKFDFVNFAWNGIENGKKKISQRKKNVKKKKISALRKTFEEDIFKKK